MPDDALSFVDQRTVPEGSILISEQHHVAVGDPSGRPRFAQEQQREQSGRLRLVRQELGDGPGEAESVASEGGVIAVGETVAVGLGSGRGETGVVDEVHDRQDPLEPAW